MKSTLVNLLIGILAIGYVQSDCSDDVDIEKQGDLKSLSGCSTYSGKITFKNAGISEVSFSDLEKLEGELKISGDKAISGISFPKLKTANKITIANLTGLGKLDFPKLSEVTELVLQDLTPLQQLTFNGGLSKVGKFEISRTQLTKVDGLSFESVDSVKLFSNVNLQEINFPKLKQTKGEVRFEANNVAAKIQALKLETVGGDVYYTNSSVFSAPEIKEVKGLVHLAGCSDTKFEFKKLEKIGKSLTLTTNLKLKEALFPVLAELTHDGILVVNNPNLKKLDIKGLEKVAGGFTIENPSIATLNLSNQISVDGAISVFANLTCEGEGAFYERIGGHASGSINCTNSNGNGDLKLNDTDSGSKNSEPSASLTSVQFSSIPLLALFAGFYLL
ncbi:hypothetical protein K502DRAFT_367494 [Neoconidiobolus thromboides FSU 785]|nr:hypothetical protein K502DRAFT_367494 [Neoconidiobolus thromboides FSU 785]